MQNTQILEKADIFADLTSEHLEKILNICKEVFYYQGELIFAENSPSTEFYIVLEGEVRIEVNLDMVIRSANPHALVPINIMRPGQSFGEVALVDQGIRSASARCYSMLCQLLVIDREDLLNLIQEDTQMGLIIMTNLARDLCLKIRLSTLNLREGLFLTNKQEEHE